MHWNKLRISCTNMTVNFENDQWQDVFLFVKSEMNNLSLKQSAFKKGQVWPIDAKRGYLMLVGWGDKWRGENDANEMTRKTNWQIFKEVTEKDMLVHLHGFQGLPLPGSGVTGQGLCDDDDDDDDKRWRRRQRDQKEGSNIVVWPSRHSHLHQSQCVQSTGTCWQHTLLQPRLSG